MARESTTALAAARWRKLDHEDVSRFVRSGMRSAAQSSSWLASQAGRMRRGRARRARARSRRESALEGRGAEGERDRAEPQLEQAIAAPGLAVVVALGRGAGRGSRSDGRSSRSDD